MLIAAGVFFSIAVLFYGVTTYYSITREVPSPLRTWITYETGNDTEGAVQDTTDVAARTYASGSYAQMIAVRARQLPRDMCPDTDDAFIIGMFLLGLYAGRRRLFHDVPEHRQFIQRVQKWGVLVGIAANAAFVAGGSFDPPPTSTTENLGRMCLIVGAPAMAFAYASSITLLVERESWRRRLAPLAAVGRTALSNYLLQSVICTLIFYSYGLDLFGKVSPSLGLLLTIAIFLIQLPLSVWWLRRFRFGPVEWLWRSLTYWQRQPMRVAPASTPVPAALAAVE